MQEAILVPRLQGDAQVSMRIERRRLYRLRYTDAFARTTPPPRREGWLPTFLRPRTWRGGV